MTSLALAATAVFAELAFTRTGAEAGCFGGLGLGLGVSTGATVGDRLAGGYDGRPYGDGYHGY